MCECNTMKKCTDIDINKIGKFFEDWESLAHYFKLSHREVVEIKKDNPYDYGKQKRELLFTWRRKLGDEATLGKLRTVLMEAGQTELVHSIDKERGLGMAVVGAASNVNDTPTNQRSTMASVTDSPELKETCKPKESRPPNSDQLRFIFKENLADLASLVSDQVVDFSNRLESASLIDDDFSEEVMSMRGVGKIEKATSLLKAVQKKMKVTDSPSLIFIKLCGILGRYSAVEEIAKGMMAKAGFEWPPENLPLPEKKVEPTYFKEKNQPLLHPVGSVHDYTEFTVKNYGVPKLKELLQHVHEIPDCWENVGIQLDISQPHLNAIRMKISNGGNPANFFKDIFIHWEQAEATDSPYSWKTFLEALSSPFVGKSVLADAIAEDLRKKRKL